MRSFLSAIEEYGEAARDAGDGRAVLHAQAWILALYALRAREHPGEFMRSAEAYQARVIRLLERAEDRPIHRQAP